MLVDVQVVNMHTSFNHISDIDRRPAAYYDYISQFISVVRVIGPKHLAPACVQRQNQTYTARAWPSNHNMRA